MLIWNESDEYLFYGFEDDGRIPEYYKKVFGRLFEEKNLDYNDESKYYWKYFQDDEKNRIVLSDFSIQATFDLIDEKNRGKIIKDMVNDINAFLKNNLA